MAQAPKPPRTKIVSALSQDEIKTVEPGGGFPVADNVAVRERIDKEQDTQTFFNDIFTMADEVRKPREQVYRIGWDLYNGVYDWSSKDWWQSKANFPLVRESVDRAVAAYRNALLKIRTFYAIESESKLGYEKGQFTVMLMDYWFDQVHVVDALVDSFKLGLITGVSALKIWWELVREPEPRVSLQDGDNEIALEYKDVRKGKLGFRALDPFNVWKVPWTGGRIERTVSTIAEIQAMIEDGVYEDKLDEVKEHISEAGKENEEARRKGESPPKSSKYIRPVELFHYWGDFYNDEGMVIESNIRFTMAGKDIVLRERQPNPLLHRKSPYVIGTPYPVPFSDYNRGMVEDIAELAKKIVELSNLIVDGALFDAIKAFVINIDALEDPTEAKDGVYPGKVFTSKLSQVPPGTKVVETVDVGKVPTEAMAARAMLMDGYQSGSSITEFIAGRSGKGDKTLGEVSIKTSQAMEVIDESARNLETTVIEPALELSSKTIYQFHQNYLIPRLAENFPQTAFLLQDLTPIERYVTMISDMTFKARGMSVLLDRQASMDRIISGLTLMSHIPGLLERLNVDGFLEEIVQAFGWNQNKLLLNPATPNVQTFGPNGIAVQSSPLIANPGDGSGNTPAEQFSAQQGGITGGATNNPVAAGQTASNNNRGNAAIQGLLQLLQGSGGQA